MKSSQEWRKYVKAIDKANKPRLQEFITDDCGYQSSGKRVSVRISLDFEVPVETLFMIFTNLDIAAKLYWPIRIIHLKSSGDNDDQFGVNSERALGPLPFVRYSERIVEKKTNSRLAWTVIGKTPIKNQYGVMDFTPLENGRSRMVETVSLDAPFSFMAPFLAKEIWASNVSAFLRAQTLINENSNFHQTVVALLEDESKGRQAVRGLHS
ncbi:hypothetical protein A9Q81_17210 [Gammaproteobacteria bacterium 42_54_T18]|nr:hypothetical protein A9Q81_17210 [Gammaproteobacteria bacterium 42_54_T18]